MLFNKNKLTKHLILVLACGSSYSYAVEFHGYVRGGITSSTNGEMDSYRINNLGRFGNETDGYYDIALQQVVYDDNNGKSFTARMDAEGNMDMRNNWESVNSSSVDTKTTNPMAVTNYYISGKGFISAAPEASLWIGKRSYKSRELQMMDYKYVGIFGPGVGVEGIKNGNEDLSFALIRNDATADVTLDTSTKHLDNTNIIDIRYADIPVFQDGKLEFIVDYAVINKTALQEYKEDTGLNYKAYNSFQPSVILTTPVKNGFNETVLQYADKGYAANLVNHGYMLNADSNYENAKAYRLINSGEVYLTDTIVMDHAIAYGHATGLGSGLGYDSASDLSLAVRPEYIWDEHNKTGFEIAWFKRSEQQDSAKTTIHGNKFTLAHIISMGKSQFVRPELRFYTTYLKADGELPFADDKDHQLSFGAQMEAWW